MTFDCSRLTNSFWILTGIYWAYSSMHLEPVVRKERSPGRALHVGIMLLACFLLFSARASVSVLAHRFVAESPSVCSTGLGLTALGCGFAIWARASLGGNWSGTVTLKQSHELVRRGPYAMVRHPIYMGLLVAAAGTALEVGEVRAVIAVGMAFLAFFQKTRREEEFLRDQFGGEYALYSRSVKRLIPFVL